MGILGARSEKTGFDELYALGTTSETMGVGILLLGGGASSKEMGGAGF